MPMTMPKILDCDMTNCSYNSNNECHAMAITVGGSSPICDTCLQASKKGGAMDMIGSVGACKVEICQFNQSLECSAQGIHVGHHTDHAECNTFESIQ